MSPTAPAGEMALEVINLRKVFRIRKGTTPGHDDLVAVDDVLLHGHPIRLPRRRR